jgi:hypothetical protein
MNDRIMGVLTADGWAHVRSAICLLLAVWASEGKPEIVPPAICVYRGLLRALSERVSQHHDLQLAAGDISQAAAG